MHKNIFWQFFLFIVGACTVWYSVVAWHAYYRYSHLTAYTVPSAMSWEVEEKSEEHYLLKAFYRFNFQGKSFTGTSVLTDEAYRNLWGAQKALPEYAAKEWRVWFDSHNPDYSSLQKKFPIKECLSAIFLWGLLLYFLWLGFYVAKFTL